MKQGEAAPYAGWLLTDSAVAKILEAGERCLDKTSGNKEPGK